MTSKSVLLLLTAASLAVLLLRPGQRWRGRDQHASRPELRSVPDTVERGRDETKPEAALGAATLNFHWAQIQTRDLKLYVSQLHSIGCPEETVRDIILGLVHRQYAPRLSALRRAAAVGYWQCWQRRTQSEHLSQARQQRAIKELEQERDELIANVLGVAGVEYATAQAATPDRIQSLLADINVRESGRAQARLVLSRYDALERDVATRAGGTLGLAEQTELRQLYTRKIDELRRILTPQELEEFELRSSPLALRLRTADLIGFSPTEQEFRGIFRILQGLDRLEAGPSPTDQAQAEWQMRQFLGEKRFADYTRCQDLSYRGLVELAGHYGIEAESAAQVHDMREAVLCQTDALHNNAQVTDGMRQAALQQIQAEANKAVRSVFGDELFNQYLETQLGQWLKLIPSWTNGVAFRD